MRPELPFLQMLREIFETLRKPSERASDDLAFLWFLSKTSEESYADWQILSKLIEISVVGSTKHLRKPCVSLAQDLRKGVQLRGSPIRRAKVVQVL